MTESETWKDVVGYEGLYEVSNRGNVHSVERISSQNKKCGGITLKPTHDKDGYLLVSLYKNGVVKTKKIHRLVTETFIPNPNGLPQVNHIDEVKGNNNVENLEWCDSSYNNNYGTRKGRLNKKVRAVNIETGEVITFSSVKEAVSKGYSRSGVSKACRGVYNTGGGNLYRNHHWYYEEEK